MTDTSVPSIPHTHPSSAPRVQVPSQEDDLSFNTELPCEEPPQYSAIDTPPTGFQSFTVESPHYAPIDDPHNPLPTSIFTHEAAGASEVHRRLLPTPFTPASPASPATQFDPSSQQWVQRQRTSGPTPRSWSVNHVFQLKDNKELTLNLQSKARRPESTPVFHGGDVIQGDVSITANDSSIQSILLTLVGQVVTSSFEEGRYTFLEQTATVWSKRSSPRSTLSILPNGQSWPISFPFPDKIPLDQGKAAAPQVVNAPQSFLEKSAPVNIKYELVLRVFRGRFKSDFKFRTPITYLTRITPNPPSPLMQVSYQQNTPLAGPKVDQVGWTTLSPATARGTFANQRDVEIQYALSLANPLCYTRGYVIPLSLTIECQDSEALKALASPKATSVVLKRRITWFTEVAAYLARDPEKAHVQIKAISDAVIWIPPKDGLNATSEKRLEGEIHLDDTLQPSCDFPLFLVEYFVMLYPPYDDAFEPESRQVIATQCVRVGTFLPTRSPAPRSFSTEFGDQRGSSLNEGRQRSQAQFSEEDNWGTMDGYGGGSSYLASSPIAGGMPNTLKDPKASKGKSKGKGKAVSQGGVEMLKMTSFPWPNI